MKRLTRITAILIKLQAKKVVTSQELADRFEVSQRTIYRDIQSLVEAGVPIGSEVGMGYFLVEGYSLPPIMFTEPEANALVTASKIIDTNNEESLKKSFREAVDKVKAVLKVSQKEKLQLLEERIVTPPQPQKEYSDSLSTIQKAITDLRLLEIEYVAASQNYTVRLIEPLGIYFTNQVWVLIAFCRMRKDYREFRTDRIKNIKEMSEIFPPRFFSFEDYFRKYHE